MYNTYQEFFTAVNTSQKMAKSILDAVNTCFKRNLVIIMDDTDDWVITGFSANRKNVRLKR